MLYDFKDMAVETPPKGAVKLFLFPGVRTPIPGYYTGRNNQVVLFTGVNQQDLLTQCVAPIAWTNIKEVE